MFVSDSDLVWKRYLKGASERDPNMVKGASIISGFLKGAYKFIWIGYEYKVGGPVDYNFIVFSRINTTRIRSRSFDVSNFLRKTIYTENTRGEYRYRLEGFPVG